MFNDLLAIQNKALVMQFYKSFDHRRLSAGLALLSPNLVAHMAGVARPLSSAEFAAMGREVYEAFPDGQHVFDQVIAHRDRVTTSGFFSGTHLGEFKGIPPTGRSVRFAIMHIDRVSYSKIVEHWGMGDSLSMVQQLGMKIVPGPGTLLKLGVKKGRQIQGKMFDRMSAIAQPDDSGQRAANLNDLGRQGVD
ncbi:MAG: ester cyclase [Leptolyngbya foveolarum]|uniref:Ester cyclase n=1 Tax=Leptolyngbya foveolarum TaxID=47253 RepID=A0A2W4U0V7_9CYAN|nr:MAG: ester cyclase [Leptolyngbya foveolarum]